MTTSSSGSSSFPIPARDDEVARLVEYFLSGSHRDQGQRVLMPDRWPTPEQRARLAARYRLLIEHLSDHDRRAVGAAVADLLACYRNALRPNEDVKTVVAKYVQELAGVPTWACLRACAAIRLGQAPGISLAFPPSTIELRHLASSYCATVHREVRDIFEVLHARRGPTQISDEERLRVSTKLKTLASELREHAAQTVAADTEARSRIAAAVVEHGHHLIEREYRAAGLEPVRGRHGELLSLSLARQLGRLPNALSEPKMQ
jgi:hypothetical protein